MKKFFGIYDKEEQDSLKEKILTCENIDKRFINFIEVQKDDEHYTHVTLIDDFNYEDKEDLVMLHGFGASSVLFYKLFKHLMPHFRIYAVDLPGMGW